MGLFHHKQFSKFPKKGRKWEQESNLFGVQAVSFECLINANIQFFRF